MKECLENKETIHDFIDSVPVRKLHACCKDMQKFWAKQAVLVGVFKAKVVQSFCDYLLKRVEWMMKSNPISEQLILCDFRKWSSTALKTLVAK